MFLNNNCIETFVKYRPTTCPCTSKKLFYICVYKTTKLLQWWADMHDALTYKQTKYSADCRVLTELDIKLVKRKQWFLCFL